MLDSSLLSASLVMERYKDDSAPQLTISRLSLEEVLCHVRIVFKRLAKFHKRLSKSKKALSALDRKKCKKSFQEKSATRDQLWNDISLLRINIRQHEDLLKKLQAKSKIRVKEAYKGLPRQVFVSSNAPPIPVYNRFAILEEDPPIITKTWSDFIHPERIELPPEFLPEQTKSFPLHEPTPVMAPVDALFQLRYDMGQHGPIMTQREPTMAYGVKGCYKSPEAAQYRTLMVTTWNINGINGQKARLVVRLMKQDTSDILICVDTRHSEQTV